MVKKQISSVLTEWTTLPRLLAGLVVVSFCLLTPSALLRNVAALELMHGVAAVGEHRRPSGNLESAERWYAASLRLDPGSSLALRGMALAQWRQGNLADARRNLARYVEREPTDKSARLFQGDIEYELGNPESAYQLWQPLGGSRVFVGRAGSHIESGELDRARIELELAEGSDDPGVILSVADAYGDLARTYARLGDPGQQRQACDDAQRVYEQPGLAHPWNASARVWYGSLLRDCGKLHDSVAQLHAIDASYPSDVRSWAETELGLTYRRMGDLPEAVAHFEKAIALNPSHGGRRIALGNAYAALGRKEDALAQYRAVLQMSDDSWRAWAESEIQTLER